MLDEKFNRIVIWLLALMSLASSVVCFKLQARISDMQKSYVSDMVQIIIDSSQTNASFRERLEVLEQDVSSCCPHE